MSDESSEEDDYAFGDSQETVKRYPVHDCCQYEDIEALFVSWDYAVKVEALLSRCTVMVRRWLCVDRQTALAHFFGVAKLYPMFFFIQISHVTLCFFLRIIIFILEVNLCPSR
jgi:uncharacterized membrane protein YhaH (DUF805 family)